MGCQTCCRSWDSGEAFYCPECARERLYPLRYDIAKVLLEKEAAGRQIEEAVTKATYVDDGAKSRFSDPSSWSTAEPSKVAVETMRTLKTQSEIRTEAMRVQIAKLRREIEEGKQEIARRRAALAKRRSDAESANYKLPERRAALVDNVQMDIKRVETMWNNLHTKTAESRIFLCREVASLYNLRQKSRRKNGEIINTYSIGGMHIVDPRDMNNANPAHITTSLSRIAHLLVLVSHYLAIRLPAEVTLPHRGYPLPTIFTPMGSYIAKDVPFPGLSPSSSFGPGASRNPETQRLPRPRPLFLDRNLPKLAKEDPAGYTLFIEGVALLAWDVSWVCRSQGLQVGLESWEDVCDIGRNLWQLLVAPPALIKALSRRNSQSRRGSQSRLSNNGKDKSNGGLRRTRSLPLLGHYSHGTAHSFLRSAEGLDFMKTWKLPSYTAVKDSLKSMLLAEMATAEWEFLEEEEWDEAGAAQLDSNDIGNAPVLVSTFPPSRDGADAGTILAQTIVSDGRNDQLRAMMKQKMSGAQSPVGPSTRPKGTKGWTKVKNR